jgi:hypothetical protein
VRSSPVACPPTVVTAASAST